MQVLIHLENEALQPGWGDKNILGGSQNCCSKLSCSTQEILTACLTSSLHVLFYVTFRLGLLSAHNINQIQLEHKRFVHGLWLGDAKSLPTCSASISDTCLAVVKFNMVWKQQVPSLGDHFKSYYLERIFFDWITSLPLALLIWNLAQGTEFVQVIICLWRLSRIKRYGRLIQKIHAISF